MLVIEASNIINDIFYILYVAVYRVHCVDTFEIPVNVNRYAVKDIFLYIYTFEFQVKPKINFIVIISPIINKIFKITLGKVIMDNNTKKPYIKNTNNSFNLIYIL